MSWNLTNQSGDELAKVLNFTPALDRTKIITKLYGGKYLAQTVGTPAQRPTATILVESLAELRAVNEAEAACTPLRLTYRETVYIGYIIAAPKWTPVIRGRVYTAPVEFAVLEEVAAT